MTSSATVVRPGLRCVIFDFGGVLTLPLYRDHSHVPADYMGAIELFLRDIADIYHLPTGAHDMHQMEIGAISEAEFFTRLARRHQQAGGVELDPATLEKYIFGSEVLACAEMIDAVRQLRHAGLRTGLITNISLTGLDYFRTLVPVDELFDVIIDSSRERLRKPDPAIYRLCCRRLGVEPGECLFVDDIACNVDAAIALGMDAIQCHDPEAVAQQVVQYVLGHPSDVETDVATAVDSV